MLQLLVSAFLTVNYTFALPLTNGNLDYFSIIETKTKGIIGHKGALKAIRLSTKNNTKIYIQK